MRQFLFVAAGLLASTLTCRADTLSFVGTPYDIVSNKSKLTTPYTFTDFVTGYVAVTLNAALLPNRTYYSTPTPGVLSLMTVDFSFNDGVQTLDSSNSSLMFDLDTDANGNIRFYSFDVLSSADPLNDTIYVLRSPTHQQTVAQINSGNYGRVEGAGTLTVTVTPEPSSFILLSTGLLAAAGLVRKRYV